MVKYCIAFGCKNIYTKGNLIQFHRFPHSRQQILKQWIQAIRRKNWEPTKHSVICSEHFTEDCYKLRPGGAKLKYLKEDAVPTLFNFPEHLQKPIKKRRDLVRHTPKLVEHDEPMDTNGMSTPVGESEGAVLVTMEGNKHQEVQTDPIPQTPTKMYLRKKIKKLQMKLNRRNKKIKTMKDLIFELKKKGHLNTDLESVLQNYFCGFPLQLILNQFKNENSAKSARRYSNLMKQFALTLYFYSPRAYKYVRSLFCLPHKNMLKRWVSSFNCEPGFLEEVFLYLKKEIPNKTYLQDCALIFDSMSLRKQLMWDSTRNRHCGYVDLGGIVDVDQEELATEALVFIIVSYTYKFKCPVGYFFITKLSADVQTQLVQICISKLNDVGILVRSITCDGTAVNLQTFRKLGCKVGGEEIQSSFKHPSNNCDIYAVSDPCHMLKLARNTLAEKKIIVSCEGEIKWSYIIKLHQLQAEQGLTFANSLSAQHINFQNKKMNVSLAAQTLSSSIADALEFLEDSGHPDFQNCKATISFIRNIDKLFDLLNSRNVLASGFKQPLRLSNMDYWQGFFVEVSDYIKSLSIEGVPILHHPRKTFALGFLLCIQSITNLSKDLLMHSIKPLEYFLAYKLSQDHIELLFSCIRSMGGWNNNPNTNQFQSAVRKLLLKNSVTASKNANVVDTDSIDHSPIFEFRSSKRSLDDLEDDIELDDSLVTYLEALNRSALSDYQSNIVYYICGFLVRKIIKSLRCSECCSMLVSYFPLNAHNYCKPNVKDHTSFVKKVSRGGLIYAAEPVFKIVQYTEKVIFSLLGHESFYKSAGLYSYIINCVCHYFSEMDPNIFPNLHTVDTAIECEDLHETQILKKLVKMYTSLRLRANAKKQTINAQGNTSTIRQKLHKLILFSNV